MGDHKQRQQHVSDALNLPPGFRFHPSDEEIITFYLTPKVLQRGFTCTAIGEIDLNKTEPWDLPEKAKMMGEKEWYFFFEKDRKYPTGMRANRATEGGYWKATGKDKEIYKATPGVGMMPLLVGMKKTLVFYKGRAPRGDKTSWVMHEYRLDGSGRLPYPISSSTSSGATMTSTSKDQWVVCRVFHKTSGVKKAPAVLSYPIDMRAGSGDIDQTCIPLPMPMQFPILPDFTLDPMASFYPTAGASSSMVLPLMPPMVGMGSAVLQVNDALFGNLMVPPPMPFCHQMGMGVAGAGGSMAVPESRASMVSQKDARMSPDQTRAIEIASMVSTVPAPTSSMGMDGMWKY
ncbi:hypothetical protein U9M48_020419 [Paspalum notatum var. saurae]|uniref:NAC domain-containing protein n=1 Tax=Paspalum notatum var. saurae TaxID=547442 RepID=A0AAQ3TGU7_PASNO